MCHCKQNNVFYQINYAATLMLLKSSHKLTITCSKIVIPIHNLPKVSALILKLSCKCKVRMQDQTLSAPPLCIFPAHNYRKNQFLLTVQWYIKHLSKNLPFKCIKCDPNDKESN